MSTATVFRSEQQADLLKQLERAGASVTATGADTLDALKSNSLLARDILEAMDKFDGVVYNFQSVRPRGTRRTGK